MKVENDLYQLTIFNPKSDDAGKYTLEINAIKTEAFLQVEEPDPVYSFLRPLNKVYNGYLNREVELECTVSSGRAQVTWYKGDKKLADGDLYEISKDLTGNCRLLIKKSKAKDAGEYSCRIDKQDTQTKTALKLKG